MDSIGGAPPKKKTKLNSSSGTGATHSGARVGHPSSKDSNAAAHQHSSLGPPGSTATPTTPPSGPNVSTGNNIAIGSGRTPPSTPKIQIAKEKPPDDKNSPSQVQVEELSVVQADLDSEKPYNLIPKVKVPKSENARKAPKGGAYVQSTEDILGWDSQYAYIQRWVKMTKEEKIQNVQFQVVKNDSRKENLLLLLGLKNVFVKQLPNMPRPYVSRLVFDRNHESLALLKRNNETNENIVMGGCCYRPFEEQKFGEIAFLAISQSEQVRGYGTRLMAQTKERAKYIGLSHLLTCADNQAVPYFKKQGFSKRITLPKEVWQGYIKDYDGVTLMECILHQNVDYLNIPMLLKAQKLALVERLREISNSHIVYPGIDAETKRGMSFDEIPGFKQLGADFNGHQNSNNDNDSSSNIITSTTHGVSDNPFGFANRSKTSLELLHKQLQSVLNEVRAHSAAWPFLEPVDAKATGAYDYYEVIENPMDLSTMQKNLDKGNFYVNKEIFIADFKRMVENCKKYNGKNQFSDMATQLEKLFMSKI